MGRTSSPLDGSTERYLSQREFEAWLEWAAHGHTSPVGVLSTDIARFPRGLRCDEAASLLAAVDRLSPIVPTTDVERPTISFLLVGTYQIEEALVAGAIAAGLGLHAVCDILPGATSVSNLAFDTSRLFAADHGEQDFDGSESEEATVESFLFVHPARSFRNLVAEAVALSGTEDLCWRSAAALLAVPPRTGRRIVVFDVKVGDQPPALSYERGMDIARALLKVAWLAQIECRVLLTDAARSSSLAFGAPAIAVAIRRTLGGTFDPAYADIAVELAAQSLSMLTPGASAAECEQRARQALVSGLAREAADSWRLPALHRLGQTGSGKTPTAESVVKTPKDGYFTGVNEPLVRLVLRGAAHMQSSSAPETTVGALMLKPLGTAVGVTDDLIEIVGDLEVWSLERVRTGILQACDITDTPLSPSSLVRVLMMLEAVLLRRHKTVVVPVTRLSEELAAYAATTPGQFHHSLLSLPDGENSGLDVALAAARRLVQELLPDYIVVSVEHDLKITPDTIVYEPEVDGLVRSQYSVMKVLVIDVGFTSKGHSSWDMAKGTWVTLRDIARDAPSTQGNERAMYEVLRHVLESHAG